MRILLVEDERTIRETLKINLELEGYEVVTAARGKIALELFEKQHFDLLVLDVMLPEVNGFDICEHIRLQDKRTPIIMLTAKDTSLDRVLGLKRGADDYLTKPFNLEELLLRIRNLLRRTQQAQKSLEDTYVINGYKINFITFEAEGNQGQFMLTSKEAMLLRLLIERKGEVVSRQQILQAVWGYDVYPSTRTIDNFILAFRKYFESNPKSPQHFISQRGVGYKFLD